MDDVCEAIYKSFNYKKFDTFNVGTSRAVKIKDLAKTIVKYSKKIKKGKRTDFDAMRSANIEKIRKNGIFTKNILEQGIKNLVNE